MIQYVLPLLHADLPPCTETLRHRSPSVRVFACVFSLSLEKSLKKKKSFRCVLQHFIASTAFRVFFPAFNDCKLKNVLRSEATTASLNNHANNNKNPNLGGGCFFSELLLPVSTLSSIFPPGESALHTSRSFI